MILERLWLHDFRSYEEVSLPLSEGLTAIVGPNGCGKTNLLEAVSLLATLKSFRGSSSEHLIRRGADRAIVRGLGSRDSREVLIELEVGRGRTKAQVNRQRLQRSRDLLGALRVTVFAPDDLSLIKSGPSLRREYLDDLIVALDPRADALLSSFERVIKQRNALLKSAKVYRASDLDTSTAGTLDVWDEQFAVLGDQLLDRRYALLEELVPLIVDGYCRLAGRDTDIVATYRPSWAEPSLEAALVGARDLDLRRRVSTVGPHRDELSIALDGFDSRTEASQGEQRTLALALRIAGHRLVSERIGEPPLLLLDDVLSELDADRARALLDTLPPGQTIITSAQEIPAASQPDSVLNFPLVSASTSD